MPLVLSQQPKTFPGYRRARQQHRRQQQQQLLQQHRELDGILENIPSSWRQLDGILQIIVGLAINDRGFVVVGLAWFRHCRLDF